MVDSSHKGSSFERELARRLSKWGCGREENPDLWRSKNSGGWKYRDVPNVGDLAPDGEWGREFRKRFGVEAKHHRGDNLDFWYLWSRDAGGDMMEWWKKIRRECYRHDLCPLLVVRRNYYPDIIGYPSTLPIAPDADRVRIVGRGIEFAPLESWLEHSWDEVKEAYERWS